MKIEFDLTPEELRARLKFLSQLTLAVDGLWFVAVEESLGYDRALDVDLKVWTRYASLLVKRIRKSFPLKYESGLAAVKEIMLYDPLWWTVNMAITEDTPERLVLEVRDCPALLAMERMGRERYTCETVETAYFEALMQAIDPRVKAEALKLPPRCSPQEVCCRWRFYQTR